jgi:2-polyprenyl-3-methyl-5-hydroxy-6-metoxy-1,4-benzoquinol methylase
MDDPELAEADHENALRGLTRINALSGSAAILWRPIAALARRLGRRELRVLDLATGAGDVPRGLWLKGSRAGLRLEILGLDASPRAIEFARQGAERLHASISFAQHDCVDGKLPDGFDVVVSSLFLHHLSDARAEDLLRKAAAATRHLLLVNDLRRCLAGVALAHLAGRVLTRSPVVRMDSVRSVRAAFTVAEARRLAERAGLDGATITRRWPCRWLLQWARRSDEASLAASPAHGSHEDRPFRKHAGAEAEGDTGAPRGLPQQPFQDEQHGRR